MCPDYPGCAYCEPMAKDLEAQSCDGRARDEAEALQAMDNPQGVMNASIEAACQME